MAGKRALRRRLAALDEQRAEARRDLGAVVLGMYRAHSLDQGALAREASNLMGLENEVAEVVAELGGSDPNPAPGLTDGTVGETVEADSIGYHGGVAEELSEPDGDEAKDEKEPDAEPAPEAEPTREPEAAEPASPEPEPAPEPESVEQATPEPTAVAPAPNPAVKLGEERVERLDQLTVQLDDAEQKARTAAQAARRRAEDQASAEIHALEGDLEREQEKAVQALDALRTELEQAESRARKAEEDLRLGAAESRTAAAGWLRGQAEAMRREAERQVREELGEDRPSGPVPASEETPSGTDDDHREPSTEVASLPLAGAGTDLEAEASRLRAEFEDRLATETENARAEGRKNAEAELVARVEELKTTEAALVEMTQRSNEANARAQDAEAALEQARAAEPDAGDEEGAADAVRRELEMRHAAELKAREEELLAEREAKTRALTTAEERLAEIETHAVTAGERVTAAEKQLAEETERLRVESEERIRTETEAAVEAEMAERRRSFEEADARATAALEEAQAEIERTRAEMAEQVEAAKAGALEAAREEVSTSDESSGEEAEAREKLAAAEARVAELEGRAEGEAANREAAASWLRGQIKALRNEALAEVQDEIDAARTEGFEAGRATAGSDVASERRDPESRNPQTEDAHLPDPEPEARPSSGLTNLNHATFDDLRAIGMSITQANRVIGYRERLGGYGSLGDLDQVPGFTASLLAELKTRLEV